MPDIKKIYCPKCGSRVINYDGRATTTIAVKCRPCNKLICYNPSEDNVYTKDVPQRNTSSGMRFY